MLPPCVLNRPRTREKEIERAYHDDRGGYVGLVSGACFAEFGTDVAVVEVDAAKLAALNEGRMPIYEPGLEKLVAENVAAGRLSFTAISRRVKDADAVFIAVGTPTRRGDGHADLTYVYAAVEQVARALTNRPSSSPNPPSGRHRPPRDGDRPLGSARPGNRRRVQPEFLREGSAIPTSCVRTAW